MGPTHLLPPPPSSFVITRWLWCRAGDLTPTSSPRQAPTAMLRPTPRAQRTRAGRQRAGRPPSPGHERCVQASRLVSAVGRGRHMQAAAPTFSAASPCQCFPSQGPCPCLCTRRTHDTPAPRCDRGLPQPSSCCHHYVPTAHALLLSSSPGVLPCSSRSQRYRRLNAATNDCMLPARPQLRH